MNPVETFFFGHLGFNCNKLKLVCSFSDIIVLSNIRLNLRSILYNNDRSSLVQVCAVCLDLLVGQLVFKKLNTYCTLSLCFLLKEGFTCDFNEW